MTKQQFFTECQNRLISPFVALENEELLEALQSREDEKVIQLLDEQF